MNQIEQNCSYCNSFSTTKIDSYKFIWKICSNCGCAESYKKESYPLDFMKYPLSKYLEKKSWKQTRDRLLKNDVVDEDNSKIYDYFTNENHIKLSKEDALEFNQNVLEKYSIDINNKKILDISGGNGHFIKYFQDKYNCDCTLTEYNKNALEYASSTLNIKTQYYDFTKHKFTDFFDNNQFDVIFIRASIMFMDDLSTVLEDLSTVLKDDGIIIINYSVTPTLGTILRTQFDEYNYKHLYSKTFIVETLERYGFNSIGLSRNYDFSMYINSLDSFPMERIITRWYELKALKNKFIYQNEFTARDRRRYDMVFRKKDSSKINNTKYFNTINFIDSLSDSLNEDFFMILDRLCKKIDVVNEIYIEYLEDLSKRTTLNTLPLEYKLKLVRMLFTLGKKHEDWKFINSALKLSAFFPKEKKEIEKYIKDKNIVK